MKRKYISLFLLPFMLIGCQDDMGGEVKNPAKSGEEILFGSSLDVPDNMNVIDKDGRVIETRTIYEKAENGNYNVNWVSGDKIMIFCPQASAPSSKRVNYTVEPNPEKPTSALSLTKDDLAGLQWGTENTHRFYGIYPADAVKGTAEENNTGNITMNIPVNQPVAKWRIEKTDDGHILYDGIGNTDYAYMFAYKQVNRLDIEAGKAIDLSFTPLTTVLEIDINGPEGENESVTISGINVEQVNPDGAKIVMTGDFVCHMRPNDAGTIDVGDIEPIGDLNTVRSTITVPAFIRKGSIDEDGSSGLADAGGVSALENNYITLRKGDIIRVRMYFLRGDNSGQGDVPVGSLRLKVAVANAAAKTKTLQTADIANHKINRILLPAIEKGGTNTWMSSLDPTIFATELSIPGSKFSMANPVDVPGNSVNYQSVGIGTQFENGVRGFIVMTKVENGDLVPCLENGTSLKTTFGDVLKTLTDKIKSANGENGQEFAFVMLTYSGNNQSLWAQTVTKKLKDYKDDLDNISLFGANGEELTANTTLGDLAGKILVKVNLNSSAMYSAGEAPAAFSLYESGLDVKTTNLLWGNTNLSTADERLLWKYTECTYVTNWKIGNKWLTLNDKKDNIQTMFDAAINDYSGNEEHKIWYMNDLGGYYYDNWILPPSDLWSPDADQSMIDALTTELAPIYTEKLQSREKNAAMGLVFMNKCAEQISLTQTIIDNNFKFELRKKGTSTTTYNASYKTGGNAVGWNE